MARNLNALVLVVFAIATLLHGSSAQTRHVVGDATGWIIPPGGAATYAAWAANKTFTVGDTLVFNFPTGQHDVAKVTKSAFDACNGANALNTIMTGPATVTLNETGEQYYICTFGTHCSAGQKLAINVTRRSTSPSPAPQPSGTSPPPRASPVPTPTPTPSPQRSTVPSPAPAPGPSTGPITYTVGDTMGWIVPPGGASAYQTWASGKPFKVGDILVFNFQLNAHNVEEVTKEKFDSCNSTSPLATYRTPPVRVTLNKTGSHYFICGVPGHCGAGQKLAVNVAGGNAATSPSPAATPPSSAATPPSSGPTSPSLPSPTNPATPSPASAVSPPAPSSSAASLGAFGFFATFLSIVAAFCY